MLKPVDHAPAQPIIFHVWVRGKLVFRGIIPAKGSPYNSRLIGPDYIFRSSQNIRNARGMLSRGKNGPRIRSVLAVHNPFADGNRCINGG